MTFSLSTSRDHVAYPLIRSPLVTRGRYGGLPREQAWLAPQPGGSVFWSLGYYAAGGGARGVGPPGAMFVLSTEEWWGGTWCASPSSPIISDHLRSPPPPPSSTFSALLCPCPPPPPPSSALLAGTRLTRSSLSAGQRGPTRPRRRARSRMITAGRRVMRARWTFLSRLGRCVISHHLP